MNESNIEHLLQLTARRPEHVAAPIARERDPRPDFSDQLFQLTSPPPPKRPANDLPPAADPPRRGESDENTLAPRHPSAADAPVDTPDEVRDTYKNDTEFDSDDQTIDDGQATETAEAPAAVEQDATATDEGVESEEPTELDQDEEEAAASASTISAPTAAADLQSVAATAEAEIELIQLSEKPLNAAAQLEQVGENRTLDRRATSDEAAGTTSAVSSAAIDETADTVGAAFEETESPIDVLASKTAIAASLKKSSNGAAKQRTTRDDDRSTANQGIAQDQAKPQAENAIDAEFSAKPTISEIASSDNPVAAATDSSDKEPTGAGDRPLHGRTSARAREGAPAPPQFAIQTSAIANPSPGVPRSDAAFSSDITSATAVSDESARGDAVRNGSLPAALARGSRGGAAVHGRENGESADLNRAETARFVSRVTRAFHFAQERGGALRLRLSPPELGSLRLELSVKDGVMAANLEAETPAARRLLLDHLPALRDRLAEQNIRIERFDVDVRRESNDGQSGTGSQQQHLPHHREQHEHQPAEHETHLPSEHSAGNSEKPRAAVVSNSGINLVI